jgi:hypothetical protein
MPEITGKFINTIEIQLKDVDMPTSAVAYYMHYPGQLIRSPPLYYEWGPIAGAFNGQITGIFIDSVDVIRRRNTFQNPCNKDWEKDDEIMVKDVIKSIGCKPLHWILDGDYPTCNNSNAMKNANMDKLDVANFTFVKKFTLPCTQVQAISFTSTGTQKPSNISDLIVGEGGSLYVVFKSEMYKEIQHIRNFDAESLVGNIGGYIGLFLGFAFWQAPEALKLLTRKLREITASHNN